jgi:hypothetical protein
VTDDGYGGGHVDSHLVLTEEAPASGADSEDREVVVRDERRPHGHLAITVADGLLL